MKIEIKIDLQLCNIQLLVEQCIMKQETCNKSGKSSIVECKGQITMTIMYGTRWSHIIT